MFKVTFDVRERVTVVVSERKLEKMDFPARTETSTIKVESLQSGEMWGTFFDTGKWRWLFRALSKTQNPPPEFPRSYGGF